MSEDRTHRIVSPLARIHYVALGAALVGPLMAIVNVSVMGSFFTASFFQIAWLNWPMRFLVLLGYQTLFYYATAAVLAAFVYPFKTIARYALNRPYPDRDRAPQLLGYGIAYGVALSLFMGHKLYLTRMVWKDTEVPLYQTAIQYSLGIICIAIALSVLLRWLLPKVPSAVRKSPHRLAHALLAIAVLFVLLGNVLPPIAQYPDIQRGTAPAGAPNILLITVDTLRADRLEPYGYTKIETPATKRLAAEGMLFTRAFAPSPWTGPSFAGIFSGHYSSALKLSHICTLFGNYPTVATHLKAKGYYTEAVTTNPFLREELAFDRGYDYFEHTGSPEWLKPIQGSIMQRTLSLWLYGSFDDYRAQVMTDRAIRRLKKRSGEPFFLWVHYMDTHVPYQNHQDPRAAAFSLGYNGPFKKMFYDFKGVRSGAVKLTDADKDRISFLYDQEVAYADKHIGRLLDALDKLGLTERTAVFFTSDHGEELFDHGGIEHGHTLYQELLHVPMIIRWQGKIVPGQVNGQSVTLLDLLPTFSAIAGVQPPPDLPGVDMLQEEIPARTLYAENMLYGPQRKVMIRGDIKLSHDPAGAPEALFMLDIDPAERINMLADHPDLVAQMHKEFQDWQVAMLALSEQLIGDYLESVNLPEDLKRQLFSLGYTQGN